MKTLEEVNQAREKLCEILEKDRMVLSDKQLTLLIGMLNSLVWVAGGRDSSTMERILRGDMMTPGAIIKQQTDPLRRLRKQFLRGE